MYPRGLKFIGNLFWSAEMGLNSPEFFPEFGMPDPADPDFRLQNWHLINLFSVEKYCE
jgi:hypothetical protein